jgi:hypothetical protein
VSKGKHEDPSPSEVPSNKLLCMVEPAGLGEGALPQQSLADCLQTARADSSGATSFNDSARPSWQQAPRGSRHVCSCKRSQYVGRAARKARDAGLGKAPVGCAWSAAAWRSRQAPCLDPFHSLCRRPTAQPEASRAQRINPPQNAAECRSAQSDCSDMEDDRTLLQRWKS